MKKTIIYAIIGVLMILVVAVTVKMAQNDDTNTNSSTQEESRETTNPAAEIGENEIKLTDDNFESEIKNYKGVALVDVYLPTCSHCQAMGPVVSAIAAEYGTEYKVGKLDASANSVTASEFEVQSVPTFIFFKDGQEVDRVVGEQEKEELVNKLLSIK